MNNNNKNVRRAGRVARPSLSDAELARLRQKVDDKDYCAAAIDAIAENWAEVLGHHMAKTKRPKRKGGVYKG